MQKIIISANFTIEPIFSSLKLVLDKINLPHEIVFAPYNQIFQQLLDPTSLFRKNESGINIVFLRSEDLIENRKAEFFIGENELNKIKLNAVDLANCLQNAETFKAPLFLFNCPPSERLQTDKTLLLEFDNIQKLLAESADNTPNVFFFPTQHLGKRYKVKIHDDPKSNLLGHIPYTPEFFTALANETARQIDVYNRKPAKVLVLDCDNTIWNGVVGEDGINGIAFCKNNLFLQSFAVEQSQKGMLICLCSKNNEADVWEVFDRRSEMLLRKEHIVGSRINWQAKSSNLKSLAEELQLGLESFIFVDDDAAVCSEVQLNCPQVMTIFLPSKTENLGDFFEHLWIFDKLKITKEDRERTASYRQQVARNKLQNEAGNMDEFLKSLNLVSEISEITINQITRVSQLSLRTNQFNSTTIRRSETEIQKILTAGEKHIWTVNVRDRFGDYGLVGVIIFAEKEQILNVESFMLSCRVLGRGVEHKILQELGKKAIANNFQFINIEFNPTAKNLPFQNFLLEIGDNYKKENNDKISYLIPSKKAADFTLKNSKPNKTSDTKSFEKNIKRETTLTDYQKQYQSYLELAHLLSKKIPIQKVQSTDLSRKNLKNDFRPPQSQIEEILTEIWEKLLNIKQIGATDNFFEIGGDSLIGVSLFVEIEERLGKCLPLSALISSPTIEKLAQNIEGQSDTVWKYLVPLQSEGTKLPLFCMHAAGGNVLFYRDLANELGTNQPIYGLQARGVADKNETSHDSVEEMAKDYLSEIRQLQPNGPYQLCGSSFGGLVAFEIARQLQNVGETVSTLALFDTYAPGYLDSNEAEMQYTNAISAFANSLKNVGNQLNEIGTTPDRIRFIFNRIFKVKNRLKRKILWKKNEFDLQYSKATGKELPKDVQRNHKAIQKALRNYQPQQYEGKMILFRASDQPKNIVFDPFLGWEKFVSQKILIEVVKGTHGALTVYPFASDLGAKFNPYLNENLQSITAVAIA